LLEGIALDWYDLLFEKDDPILQTFEALITALRGRFDDPERKKSKTARKQLANIRQDKRLASEFATKFQVILGDTGYDETAA
jgi:hypothetical protein